MRILLLLLVVIIGFSLLYKYIFSEDIPDALKTQITLQPNPFTAPKDSETVIWQRALQLMQGRKSLLAGGDLAQTDSTLFLPYYNEHRKGNSILIKRKQLTDSVRFEISWWYSQKLQENGSKEIALFMQKGISRYKNY